MRWTAAKCLPIESKTVPFFYLQRLMGSQPFLGSFEGAQRSEFVALGAPPWVDRAGNGRLSGPLCCD